MQTIVEVNPDSAGAKLAKMLANEDDDSSDDGAGDDGHSVSSGRKRSADDADLPPPGSPELYGDI